MCCFHRNRVGSPCDYIGCDEVPVVFTYRDRIVWKKIVPHLCLFAHLHKISVKKIFYKGGKLIDMEDFHLWWHDRNENMSYDVMLEIAQTLVNVFPEKLCIDFDRYNYREWNDYCQNYSEAKAIQIYRCNYKGPIFDLSPFEWIDPNVDIVPFNIRMCKARGIPLPKQLLVLLHVLPLDIVGLIGEYLYVVCIKA